MKVLLLAGEESGLIYADGLRASLRDCEIRGYGDYGFKTADLAVMGFWAVLKKLFFFLRVKRTMERAIDEWRPDVVCTIDYPGLNLKLAAYAKSRGVRTVHVVCPQVWAWKKGRIPKIEASLDKLCCFFPFEPAYFRPGFAEFVGHPLAEDFASGPADHGPRPVLRGQSAGKEPLTLALLPGSRIGEIDRNLPTLLEVVAVLAAEFGDRLRFVFPAANRLAFDRIVSIMGAYRTKTVVYPKEGVGEIKNAVETKLGGAREVLRAADAAVVASGTATLEAALARCPTVLVYRVSAALAWFARRVIKEITHIGLVNIVWEKTGPHPVDEQAPMPELIQEAFTPEAVVDVVRPWLVDAAKREAAVKRLDATVRRLGTTGHAIARIAELVRGDGRPE